MEEEREELIKHPPTHSYVVRQKEIEGRVCEGGGDKKSKSRITATKTGAREGGG